VVSDEKRQVPASIGQRLMWIMERRGGANGTLNVFYAFRLRGPLREAALLDACRDIVVRHESLRTTFGGRGPGLTQTVHPPYPMPDRVLRLADVSEADLQDAVRAEAHHRIDLETEWPCRVRLFRVDSQNHVLTIVVHHMVTDGWSMGVLMEDLRALYAAHLGYSVEIPMLSEWQQADFACWQQRCAENGLFDTKAAYWREILGTGQPIGLPAALRQISPDRVHEPGMLRYDVPAKVEAFFRETAIDHRSSLFSALFAAFSGYLAACTGQGELVLPVFFANRTRKQVRRTVGYLTNLMLLPIDLADRPPFSEVVRRATQILLKAMANQDVPYHVVPLPSGEAGRRRHPELVLDYFKITGSDALEMTGVEVRSYDLDGGTSAKFALELHFIERSDGLKIACVYSDGHTCASAIVKFLDDFVNFARNLKLPARTSLTKGGDIP
jgi:hypothetical protein